jgi:hypothetical protein
MLSPVFTTAAALHQALIYAASVALLSDCAHMLPDYRPADEGETAELCIITTAIGPDQQKIRAQTPCLFVHGPVRSWQALRATFAFCPAPGVQSSFTVKGTRGRLLEMAETVRKNWANYGGGPRVEKPQAKPRPAVSWPVSILRVWSAQLEDRDHIGALLTGERLGVTYYPDNKGAAFALAAPVPVAGLPDGLPELCSVKRGRDGRWTVSDMRTGRAVDASGFGSRKAAETHAAQLFSGMDADRLANAIRVITGHDAADTAAARAIWCTQHGIEDPAGIDAQPVQPEPEPEPVPDAPADVAPDVVPAEQPAECADVPADVTPQAAPADAPASDAICADPAPADAPAESEAAPAVAESGFSPSAGGFSPSFAAAPVPADSRTPDPQIPVSAAPAHHGQSVPMRKLRKGETFTLEPGDDAPVWIKCYGGYRHGRGGQLRTCAPHVIVYRYDPAHGCAPTASDPPLAIVAPDAPMRPDAPMDAPVAADPPPMACTPPPADSEPAPPLPQIPAPLANAADKLASLRAELATEQRTSVHRSDGFLSMLIGHAEKEHARLAAGFAAFAAAGDGTELAHTDGRRFCVLLPDASEPGRYRYSSFDARGFYTHAVFDSAHQAVADAASSGFTVPAPGVMDRLASEPEWAHGMAVADIMQRHARGLLTWEQSCAELDALGPMPSQQRATPADTAADPEAVPADAPRDSIPAPDCAPMSAGPRARWPAPRGLWHAVPMRTKPTMQAGARWALAADAPIRPGRWRPMALLPRIAGPPPSADSRSSRAPRFPQIPVGPVFPFFRPES